MTKGPAPLVPVPSPVILQAVRSGVTFHPHPDGSHVATAAHRRVCGGNLEIVAAVMVAWLMWERR
jgi:hypothetical protein